LLKLTNHKIQWLLYFITYTLLTTQNYKKIQNKKGDTKSNIKFFVLVNLSPVVPIVSPQLGLALISHYYLLLNFDSFSFVHQYVNHFLL